MTVEWPGVELTTVQYWLSKAIQEDTILHLFLDETVPLIVFLHSFQKRTFRDELHRSFYWLVVLHITRSAAIKH